MPYWCNFLGSEALKNVTIIGSKLSMILRSKPIGMLYSKQQKKRLHPKRFVMCVQDMTVYFELEHLSESYIFL